MWLNIFLQILGSETIKVLLRKGTEMLLKRTDTSIDPELAGALINDIAKSDGNKVTTEMVTTVLEVLKEK